MFTLLKRYDEQSYRVGFIGPVQTPRRDGQGEVYHGSPSGVERKERGEGEQGDGSKKNTSRGRHF